MRFGSLFCGIGGFDLGLERAGMQCAWQVEIDPYAQKVLAKHWPNVRRHADVCTFPPEEGDWEVDVICGGFPCQDISYAGKGAGLAGARSGLWFEFARIIGHLRPRYVIVENVSALLNRGMGEVLGTLASLGYDAEWHVIPASAVGAPHRRDRIWIVGIRSGDGGEAFPQCSDADIVGPHRAEMHLVGGFELRDEQERDAGSVRSAVSDTDGRQVRGVNADSRDGRSLPQQGAERIIRGSSGGHDVADASVSGLEERQGQPSNARQERSSSERDGWWATEPDVGRVAHGVPARVDRLRCLGNAVVPQVVELIGRAILQHEQANK
jgi:DNA (cytosine-5)-methyltransferase 1